MTFLALGFVMIALGIKSKKAKKDYAKLTAEVLAEMIDESEKLKSDIDKLAKDKDEIIKMSAEKNAEIQKELDKIRKIEQENALNQKEDLSK